MISVTRALCQKYTDLTDDEIAKIEEYNDRLQALANAAESDAFIDCRSSTGKTAIVVCEAKPQTVPSNYTVNILGMLMNWRDEPAMDRTFRLGIPTSEMRVINAVENRKVVQTTEPIYCNGRVIAVLIYEKKAEDRKDSVPGDEPGFPAVGDISWFADYLDEAIVLINDEFLVSGRNKAAAQLYSQLGYVDDIIGMTMTNIQLDAENYISAEDNPVNCPLEPRRVIVSSHTLDYKIVSLTTPGTKYVLIIRDVSDMMELKKQNAMQGVAIRELRHRMSNSLHMFADAMRYQEKYLDSQAAKETLANTAGRLEALAATLEEIVHVTQETMSLKFVLELLRKNTLQNSPAATQNITVRITGDDVEVSASTASSVALVVNELVQNALCHAFPGGMDGNVTVIVKKEFLFTAVSVKDNGVGYDPGKRRDGAMGLDLVETIVNEKLNGELKIVTDKTGTKVSFDFYE